MALEEAIFGMSHGCCLKSEAPLSFFSSEGVSAGVEKSEAAEGEPQ